MFDARSDELTGSQALSGPALAGLLTQLVAVSREVAGVSFADASEGSVREALVVLDGCRNRLDAAAAHVAGVFDAQAMWAGDGARSSAGWIAAHTEVARGAAARDVKLGRALTAMPATDAAFSNGSLGSAKARLLADAATHAPATFPAHEAMLVDQVRGLRVDGAKSMLEFWKARANPDEADDAERRRFDARAVFVSQTLDGMWRLDGMLPGELGEVLAGELERRGQALYASDKAVADANGTPLARTAAQRRADALVDMALHASVNESGATINHPAVTAVVHVDDVSNPATQPGEPVGQTEHGLPVTKTTAERLLCDSALSRVVLDANSVPVDLGTTARLPSPAQRRALAARDGGCVFPGCDRPPGWTSAHHLVHWINDGPTDLDNLVLLCNFHHHRVHEGGFGCERQLDSTLVFRLPDGTPLTVPKQRHQPCSALGRSVPTR